MRHVREEILGGLGGVTHCDAQQNSPYQNANVICVHKRIDGVNHHVADEGGKNLGDFCRCCLVGCLNAGKRELDGESEADGNGGKRCSQCADHIQRHNGLHGLGKLRVAKGVDNQEEHQEWGNGLQRANEEGAQHLDDGKVLRAESTKQRTDNQTDDDALDEAQARPRFCNFLHTFLLEWEGWG